MPAYLNYTGYFVLGILWASPESRRINLGQLCGVLHVSFCALVHMLVKTLQQLQLFLVTCGDLRDGAEEAGAESLLSRAPWIHTEKYSRLL